jgi:adenosylmethionine-8-amino-7-oxononanoate aminotransferase
VALASLDLFEDTAALERVAALEQQMREGLAPLHALPSVGDIRVIGGVGIVELAAKGDGGYLHDIGPRLAARFLDRGLLLRPLGNVLYAMPPYVITEAETAWMIEQIGEVLAAEHASATVG